MRRAFCLVPLSLLLTACGEADATLIDPRNDVHCSVVAFYFHGLAKHEGAPADQQHATKVLHEWYAAKMRREAGERFKDWQNFEREISPLLEAIKAKPTAMTDELDACLDRAIADPAFDLFARRNST